MLYKLEDDQLAIVGVVEIKAPGRQGQLAEVVDEDVTRQDRLLRNWLGQAAEYLVRYRLQYAIVSIYTWLLCMRVTRRDTPDGTERYRVYWSRPVSFEQQSNSAQVSAREAAFGLMLLASVDAEMKTMPLPRMTPKKKQPKRKGHGKKKHKKESSSSESGSDSVVE